MNRRSLLAFGLVAMFAFASSVALGADKADKKKSDAAAVKGTVKSVEDGKITISVKVKKETEDKTFDASSAKVMINGEKKTLGDLTGGMEVVCKLSEDGKSVVSIVSGKKQK